MDQLIAKNIRRFMSPDKSMDEALSNVKVYIKGGESKQTVDMDIPPYPSKVKAEESGSTTETFYTVWDETFGDQSEESAQLPRVPTAPSGPTSSSQVFSSERTSPPKDEITYEFAPMECILHLKSKDQKVVSMETRKLEVHAEWNVSKNGVTGDVFYVRDIDAKLPFCADVEKIQLSRLGLPRFGLYVRNITLAALLASPEHERARDVLTSNCAADKLIEMYDTTMSSSS